MRGRRPPGPGAAARERWVRGELARLYPLLTTTTGHNHNRLRAVVARLEDELASLDPRPDHQDW